LTFPPKSSTIITVMNTTADLIYADKTTNYTFRVEHEGITYDAVIYCNDKGKFIDDHIISCMTCEQLCHEGTEGEIREVILDYIDANWDKLVK